MIAKKFNGCPVTFAGSDVREVSISINDAVLVLLKDGTCIEAESLTA